VRLSRHALGTGFSPGRGLAAGLLLLSLGGILSWLGSRTQVVGAAGTPGPAPIFAGAASSAAPGNVLASYRSLPLIFEANQGQSDPRVKYLARGNGYGLFLTSDEAVLSLRTSGLGRQTSAMQAAPQHSVHGSVVRMRLANSNPTPNVSAAEQLPGKSNYFIGNDPAKWHRNVPQFARVRYQDVYPGIDLVYYGQQGKLEYDFQVAPGADPRQIALRFQGADQLTVDSSGNLMLAAGGGQVQLQAPRIYQRIGQDERPVAGRFVLRPGNEAAFEIGDYDRTRELVIDPVLSYSTYLGGTADEACSIIVGSSKPGCPAIAVDSSQSAYVAGSTTSADFPVTASVVQGASAGASDVFVTKFSLTGNALLFSTYLGGSGNDTSVGIAVDSGFDVFVAGTTSCGATCDFPTAGINAPYQAQPKVSGTHAFLSEIDSTAANLLYSTYLSGSATDLASGLAVDVKNKAYVVGTTTSTDFPTTSGSFQTTSKATNQFFLSKVDTSTSGTNSLPYSTYFGGGNPANGVVVGGGVAVDSSSNVLITGGTNFLNTGSNTSTDFPILNAAQGCLDSPTNPDSCPTNVTATDAFVAKLNPTAATGAQLIYSTYVGGTGAEIGYGIAVDSAGSAYVTGSTTSMDFIPSPETWTPFQKCLNDPTNPATCTVNLPASDAFLMKINNPAQGGTDPNVTFTYASYLGGSGNDVAYAIAVDASQGALLTGYTDSTDFHISASPIQAANGGQRDAFVARIDTTSTANISSYLGGAGNDIGTGIAVDFANSTYVAGETTSATGFPVVGAYQGTLQGGSDAFVSKLGPSLNLTVTGEGSPDPVGIGNQASFIYTITNNGDLATGITFTDTLPATGANFVSATSSPGSCGSPTGSPPTVTCSVGTLANLGKGTVTIDVTPTVAGPLGNSAVVSIVGSNFRASASATTAVNDFNLGVAPASITVAAGASASYTLTITPVPTFPNSISLSCSSGLPSEATCAFSTNPIPNANSGPVTSALTIKTTIRPIPTGALRVVSRTLFAAFLPVGGLAFFGLGLGGKKSAWRRLLTGLCVTTLLSLIVFQAACGSSNSTTTPTGGTPAGTFPITVTATSGLATRTVGLTLVVQ